MKIYRPGYPIDHSLVKIADVHCFALFVRKKTLAKKIQNSKFQAPNSKFQKKKKEKNNEASPGIEIQNSKKKKG